MYRRWERLTLQKTLDAMTDLVYCPRCEAPVLEEGGGDHFGQCASCELAFCTLCREAFHPGMQCMEPEERLKVLGERARGNKNAGKAERERCDANGTLQIRKLSIYVSLLLKHVALHPHEAHEGVSSGQA